MERSLWGPRPPRAPQLPSFPVTPRCVLPGPHTLGPPTSRPPRGLAAQGYRGAAEAGYAGVGDPEAEGAVRGVRHRERLVEVAPGIRLDRSALEVPEGLGAKALLDLHLGPGLRSSAAPD